MPNLRNKKTRQITQRKITPIFKITRSSFPETGLKFRYWVTGVTKPSNRNELRYDLHNSRWIDEIREIYPMQNNHDSKGASKAIFEKNIYGP